MEQQCNKYNDKYFDMLSLKKNVDELHTYLIYLNWYHKGVDPGCSSHEDWMKFDNVSKMFRKSSSKKMITIFVHLNHPTKQLINLFFS